MKKEILRMERVTYKEEETTYLKDFELNVFSGEIVGPSAAAFRVAGKSAAVCGLYVLQGEAGQFVAEFEFVAGGKKL